MKLIPRRKPKPQPFKELTKEEMSTLSDDELADYLRRKYKLDQKPWEVEEKKRK